MSYSRGPRFDWPDIIGVTLTVIFAAAFVVLIVAMVHKAHQPEPPAEDLYQRVDIHGVSCLTDVDTHQIVVCEKGPWRSSE